MTLNINQFAQSPVKGMLDLKFNPETIVCRVSDSEVTALVPGQAVKISDVAGGIPVVTAVAADTDDVYGFVNYNIKNQSFAAGVEVEISFFRGNVMYMEASAAMARNAQVAVVVAGQKIVTAGAGQRIVGRLIDKASADGDLVRVVIDLPGATA